MTDTVFKTAQPETQTSPAPTTKQAAPEPVIATTKTPTNLTLDEARQEANTPYAAKFFNINTDFDYLPSNVQNKLTAIDKFVETEIAERGWKPTAQAFERTLANLALELGADSEDLLGEIERVGAFAENMLKLNGVDEVRKQLRSKLRRMQTGKEMSGAVLKAIGKTIL